MNSISITARLTNADLVRRYLPSELRKRLASIKMAVRNYTFMDLLAEIKGVKLQGEALQYRSGNLSRHIRANTTFTETEYIGRAFVAGYPGQVPYARIHEYGGIIRARNAPYLTFRTEDGRWHRVKQVTMPERSYMRSSLRDTKEKFYSRVRNAVQGVQE